MIQFHRQQLVPYTTEQMFALVSDVPSYATFLPLCRSAEVLSWEDDVQIARLVVAKGPIQLSWTTHNQMIAGQQINMQLVEGPFARLEGSWDFTALDAHASQIALELRYDLSNSIRAIAERVLFDQLAHSLINAFLRRAGELYGAER